MLYAKININNQEIVIQLDNNYKEDCVQDLNKLDSFIQRTNLDTVTKLVQQNIRTASKQDIQDAMFGTVFGRKGLKTSLTQSAQGNNPDKTPNPDLQKLSPSLPGVYLNTKTNKYYISGKLVSGNRSFEGFIPKGIVVRIKDLFKEKLNLECGKWVNIETDTFVFINNENPNQKETTYNI